MAKDSTPVKYTPKKYKLVRITPSDKPLKFKKSEYVPRLTQAGVAMLTEHKKHVKRSSRLPFLVLISIFLSNLASAIPSLIVALLILFAASGVVLYYIWGHGKADSMAAKLTSTVLGLGAIWFCYLADSNVTLIYIDVLLLVGAYIVHLFLPQSGFLLRCAVVYYVFSDILSNVKYINEIDGFFTGNTTSYALILAAALCLFHVVFRKYVKPHEAVSAGTDEKKNVPLLKKVFVYLLVAVIAYAAVFFVSKFTLMNLNLALDTSEPEVFVGEIVDKDVHRSRRRRTYSITVEYDGQKRELNIYSGMYQDCEIGDEILLGQFEGSFGDRYIIPALIE